MTLTYYVYDYSSREPWVKACPTFKDAMDFCQLRARDLAEYFNVSIQQALETYLEIVL